MQAIAVNDDVDDIDTEAEADADADADVADEETGGTHSHKPMMANANKGQCLLNKFQ